MRTLSSFSRAMGVAAIITAAALILGGAYFVGYVSEIQRTLNDQSETHAPAAQQIAAVERALGYSGFLKTYRNYRLTGDAAARRQLTAQAIDAEQALTQLATIYAGNAEATEALREARSVGEAFAHVAQTAPETGETALRGTAAMNDLAALPQPPQLEASYLALRTALDGLKVAEQDRQLGGVAYVLNWSQVIIIAAICALVVGLLISAGLLQLGIIQPLKTLERSLASVGDGAVAQQVWGTDRQDEFGALARAGEKLRRGLTETTALKALSEKGQLHLTLDGQSSVLLQRLADDVTTTTNALKSAAADFARLQDGNRQSFEATLANLSASATGASQAAETLSVGTRTAVDDLRTANAELNANATERLEQLDRLSRGFEQTRRQVDKVTAGLGSKATAAIDDLTASAASLQTAADNAGKIQAMFAESYGDISFNAGQATDKVRSLAARLSDTIGLVDERLSRKLAALDALEHAVTTNLEQLRAKAEEASLSLTTKAGESNDLQSAIARLDEIAGRLASPQGSAPALDGLAGTLQNHLETVRAEIRDLAIRMTEERLLATSDGGRPTLLRTDDLAMPHTPHRTLADVPGAEIMARLKDLAAEMNAARQEDDQTASLKAALGKFAAEVKDLAASADRTARLKAMGRALDEHAEEIEAHMPAVEPSTALRTELAAITGELRSIAARAQANGTKDGPELRESAIEVGARAESLFTYLSDTHPAADDADDEGAEGAPDAAADIAALTHLIDRIEARASSLAAPQGLDTNGAIHLVFESIGRLNNIATALARAGHAERQRHATH